MSRKILHDFLAGQLFTGLVLRGKCRYERHESVRLVDGEWWGESSRAFGCPLAPQDTCPVCGGAGFHELKPDAVEQFDEGVVKQPNGTVRKPCLPCRGKGYVPGPHWPYRHDAPPPLRMRG